ncbi:uncharacterized protein si:dkeyp-110g5.4 isoform X1 [Oncorhynchus masou masou]|uniref:uncharacterized protein si:dkeyp-110g5.4 isoform X1 n=2 Tax=Oncorhynchus masou masou TaxID=90313 RepID=UPI003182DA9B
MCISITGECSSSAGGTQYVDLCKTAKLSASCRRGKMRGIDILENFEIYIPKEAEVKITSILTLPTSILRRMGVPHSQGGSAKRVSSPLATWISPVVIRERGCSPASPTVDTAKINLTSMVTKEPKAAQSPFLIPFVSSSGTAFNVLREFLPSRQNFQQGTATQIDPLPHGLPPVPHQDAIIIHKGRIFLSIKKAKTIRGKRQHSPDLNNLLSSEVPQITQRKLIFLSPARKSQKKSSPASPKPSPKKPQGKWALLQRFGLTHQVQVKLSRIPQGDIAPQQTAEEDHNTEQDQVVRKLLNANRLLKETPGRCPEQEMELVTQEENQPLNEETQESLSKTANWHPCSSEGFQGRGGITSETDDDAEEEPEEEGCHNLGSVKQRRVEDKGKSGAEGQATNGDESEVEDLSVTAVALSDSLPPPEALNADQSSDTVMQVDFTGDSVQSWTAECPIIPALAPTPKQHHGFDFEHSAREERINRIRAKLREREAALNNLRSSS